MTDKSSDQGFDRDRAKQFTERLFGMINATSVTHMVSLGNRTGLFDAMATLGWSTSAQVADTAGLVERYVREWLGAMVTGGIVDYDRDTDSYRLPAEHAASLVSSMGPRNLSTMAKLLCSVSRVEPAIADRFRTGGGLAYSEFPEFHSFQREASGAVHEAILVNTVLPMIDGLVDRLTAGIAVADVGCGAGRAINLMARAFPASTFVGFDFSDEAVEMGRLEAAAWSLDNVAFETRDAAELDEHERFQFITTFDAIHDQAHPAIVVKAIERALTPDGTWLCVDVAGSSHVDGNVHHPLGPLLYGVSTMHCLTVSLAYDGAGLGAMWGEEQARQMFTAAGFGSIEVRTVRGDLANNYYICTKRPNGRSRS